MNWNELKPQIIDLIYTYGFQPDGGVSYILKNPCKRRPSPIVVIDDSNTKSQFAVVRMNTITYTLYPNGKESFTSSEHWDFIDKNNCEGFSGMKNYTAWFDMQKTIIDKAILLHKKEELADKQKKLSKDF